MTQAPSLCSFSPDELHEPKDVQIVARPPVRFNLRISEDPEHEGCYLPLGHTQPLEDCGFNVTAKTFFIIHGWAVRPGEGALQLYSGFGFFCFGPLQRILVLPDSTLSPPLFLWAACISDSCEECNGRFAEGATWTPAGWCLMLAHSGFLKVALLRAATQLHQLLRIPLITLNYIGQPLPPGGHPSLRAELS